MQHRDSQYGRESIDVDDAVPLFAIDHKLGNVHVGTPDADVVKLLERGVQDSQDPRWTRSLIDEAIRYALWAHAENRAEYGYVMGGIR